MDSFTCTQNMRLSGTGHLQIPVFSLGTLPKYAKNHKSGKIWTQLKSWQKKLPCCTKNVCFQMHKIKGLFCFVLFCFVLSLHHVYYVYSVCLLRDETVYFVELIIWDAHFNQLGAFMFSKMWEGKKRVIWFRLEGTISWHCLLSNSVLLAHSDTAFGSTRLSFTEWRTWGPFQFV